MTSELKTSRLIRIAIDLTPMLPGGENGGAKLMIIELIRYMSRYANDVEFVLFTSNQCHDALSDLDAKNVRRTCIVHNSNSVVVSSLPLAQFKSRLKEWLKANIPAWLRMRLTHQLQKIRRRFKANNLLKEIGADLLFCPFTTAFFFDAAVPKVSVIYDLQHHYYPQFFAAEELFYRNKFFVETWQTASRLVCISDHVRRTVIENSDIDPKRVETAYIRLTGRLTKPSSETIDLILKRLNLKQDRFIFYPANFWAHKNHTMLLTAFGIYRAQNAQSDLKLVCTGAPDAQMEYLQTAARKMQLEDWVVFPGYLADEELAGLMASCRALIFPSLYEGFGMPILEAMAFGKPVLCSNVTSLPEIAGDAAVFFDPKKPVEIAQAIMRIENEPALLSKLIECGYAHVATFGGPQKMAMQYLQIFHNVVGEHSYENWI